MKYQKEEANVIHKSTHGLGHCVQVHIILQIYSFVYWYTKQRQCGIQFIISLFLSLYMYELLDVDVVYNI
jgi:hypothetical protein